MGHRLITALIFLNGAGLIGCVMLMAAALSKNDPIVAEQVTHSMQLSFRMFVAGAGLPAVAWGIAALEINRANRKIKLLEFCDHLLPGDDLVGLVRHCSLAIAGSDHQFGAG